jgi:trehalose 6-phosphate synthase
VSHEFIASQQERQGVMIISEFAGAAQSLHGSIVVNPWDLQRMADAIHEAVTMDAETRKANHQKMFKVYSPLLPPHNGATDTTNRHTVRR